VIRMCRCLGEEWPCGRDARDALAKLTANCTTVRCEDKGRVIKSILTGG
jgi:endonuclease YncB( thermonuclease family)